MRTRPERRPIRTLDEQLVNRIAAGEVVERPASALKELIENALDAGAMRLEIEAEMGGRRLIRVRDDGIGMTRTDALHALQRHATSKIASDADLMRITTLGFRGEALPSIASISRMEILTRAYEEDTGTRIVVEGGEVKSVEEVGAPIGTTVTVRDLFYNVPARLKFLKTVPTELGHMIETVTRYAFAYPDVSFRLVHERQELIFTPGNGDLLTAAASIWGRETVQGDGVGRLRARRYPRVGADCPAAPDAPHAPAPILFREPAPRAQQDADRRAGRGVQNPHARKTLPRLHPAGGHRPAPSGCECASREDRGALPARAGGL
jgi:DNA mismatch repair protein MutL